MKITLLAHDDFRTGDEYPIGKVAEELQKELSDENPRREWGVVTHQTWKCSPREINREQLPLDGKTFLVVRELGSAAIERTKFVRKKLGEAAPLYVCVRSRTSQEFDDLKFCPGNYVISPRSDWLASDLTERILAELIFDQDRPIFNGMDEIEGILGRTKKMRKLFRDIKDYAGMDENILILGETGTGKENVARGLYSNSRRNGNGFGVVNCAELTPELARSELFGHKRGAFTGANADKPGLLKTYADGVIFLDEFGELKIQAEFLRMIGSEGGGDYRPVGSDKNEKFTGRFVIATNRDLRLLAFREDLLSRITYEIKLPPLRERRADIPLLARHFVERWKDKYPDKNLKSLKSTECLNELFEGNWLNGNIRQLLNVMYNACFEADREGKEIRDHHIIEAMRKSERFGQIQAPMAESFQKPPISDSHFPFWEDYEKECGKHYFKELYRRSEGNAVKAQEFAGMDHRRIGEYWKKFELRKPRPPKPPFSS
jgi:DNA-binding NtrC family response regulator